MAKKVSEKSINRDGNYIGTVNFHPVQLNPTTGSAIGNVGTSKFEGGLKKGAKGIPTIKKSK